MEAIVGDCTLVARAALDARVTSMVANNTSLDTRVTTLVIPNSLWYRDLADMASPGRSRAVREPQAVSSHCLMILGKSLAAGNALFFMRHPVATVRGSLIGGLVSLLVVVREARVAAGAAVESGLFVALSEGGARGQLGFRVSSGEHICTKTTRQHSTSSLTRPNKYM